MCRPCASIVYKGRAGAAAKYECSMSKFTTQDTIMPLGFRYIETLHVVYNHV